MPFTAKILNESVAQSKEICYTIINKKNIFYKNAVYGKNIKWRSLWK